VDASIAVEADWPDAGTAHEARANVKGASAKRGVNVKSTRFLGRVGGGGKQDAFMAFSSCEASGGTGMGSKQATELLGIDEVSGKG
jgi:hypothetical protein